MSEASPSSFPRITTFPDPAIYRVMGEDGITRMLQAVYRVLGRSPIAELFPKGPEALDAAGAKSALFFVTICGGPPLYERRYGPPMMRARHMSFPIDEAARGHWLAAWDEVLEKAPESFGFPAEHLENFRIYLQTFSTWMVNR